MNVPDRPRRLVSRYTLSLDVHVQPAGLPSMRCQARNVGVGGMFLATDTAPELFSKVTIGLPLPNGHSASLEARVVHVLAGQRARSLGAAQGIGVQFEGLGRQEQAVVEELVAWARAHDPRPRIARLKPGADLSALQDEPMLGFLLRYVDGKRDPEALAEELALELDTIERMIAELARHGAIELVSAGEQPAQASQRPAAAVPTVRSKQPLSPPQREKLASLESRLEAADHYVLLGVPPSSSPEQARGTFLKQDAELHPSVRPPEEAQRIERVQKRMREAASVLSSPERKGEYDEYKERAERLAAADALRARLSIPPPAPESAQDTDEQIDGRFAPPPEARSERPRQPSAPALREPSARARAAAAALRRPDRAPGASTRPTSPPGAAARGSGPATGNAGVTRPPPGAAARGSGPAGSDAGVTRPPPGAAARGSGPAAGNAGATRPPPGAAARGSGPASSNAGATRPPPGAAARGSGLASSDAGATRPPPGAAASGSGPASSNVGATRPPLGAAARGSALASSAASGGPTVASPTQPPPAHARSGRSSRAPGAGARTGRPSRPVAASQAEAAAQAAAEQAAAAAALISRGRPSEAPVGEGSSQSRASEPPLGAAAQILAQAEAAYSAGKAVEALRHLKLLSAMTFDDPRIQARFAELKIKVMRTTAVDFEKQAAYEEKQQHWAAAARSWMRVVDGRPNDSIPLQRAALAQLRAADLRAAMENAKRAVELAQSDAQAHRILAKVYLAADMQASARRELEAAQRCSGASEPSEDGTPTGLLKRLLGRDDAE